MAFLKTEHKEPCRRCGKRISINGLAQYSHNKWHDRVDATAAEMHAELKQHTATIRREEGTPIDRPFTGNQAHCTHGEYTTNKEWNHGPGSDYVQVTRCAKCGKIVTVASA